MTMKNSNVTIRNLTHDLPVCSPVPQPTAPPRARRNIIIIIIIELSPSGSGYFTCKQNMKLVTTKFKLGGLHEKHVVATRNFGNHLSICFSAQGNQEKPVSRWPVAGPSEY